jgi:hypothetical protein
MSFRRLSRLRPGSVRNPSADVFEEIPQFGIALAIMETANPFSILSHYIRKIPVKPE